MQVHNTVHAAPAAPVTVQAYDPEMVYILATEVYHQHRKAGTQKRHQTAGQRVADYARHSLSNYDQVMHNSRTAAQRLEIRRQVYAQIARYYPVSRRYCAHKMRAYYRRNARGQI